MNSIVLAAALNSGLRNGIGHTTLVSDEAATSDACSSKIAYCAGIVRNASSDVFWGDQFVGVRSATTQKTSGRDAPEVFLAWNVDVGKLSQNQKENLLRWLKEWSSDRTELLEERAATRTSKTTAFSPTLKAWATTHCAKLPACDNKISPSDAIVSAAMRSKSPQEMFPARRYLIFTALIIVVCFVGYVGKRCGRSTKVVESGSNTTSGPQTHAGPPAPHSSGKAQQTWKTDLSNLQAEAANGGGELADLIGRLQVLNNEIGRVASGNELESAKEQVAQIAGVLRGSVVQTINSTIPEKVKELGADGASVDTSFIRMKVKRMDRQLDDLSAITDAIDNNDSRYAEKVFEKKICALVVGKCEYFSKSQLFPFKSADLNWLIQAGDSDLAQDVVGDEASRNQIARFRSGVAQLKKDVQIAVELAEWNTRPTDVTVELLGESGKVIQTRSIPLKSVGNGGALLGVLDGNQATFVGTFKVRCVDVLTCSRIRLTFAPKGGMEEVKVDSNDVSNYAWSTRDVRYLRQPIPVNSPVNLGRIAIVVQDEALRTAFQTLGRLFDEGFRANPEK